MTNHNEPSVQPQTPVSPWLLLRVWFLLGLQSFGGGAATLYLIQREIVERREWLSGEEFTRNWAIAQVVPGINLLSLTILIGWKLAGAVGVVVSLLGLMLPSVSITIALTAVYASVRQLTMVEAALQGVVPATVGLGLLLSWQMGRPLLAESRREGWASLCFSIAVVVGSGAVLLVWRPQPVLVLLGAGLIGALTSWIATGRTRWKK